jgi:hypothetical protein
MAPVALGSVSEPRFVLSLVAMRSDLGYHPGSERE